MLCQNLGDDRFKYGEVGKGLCQEMEIKLLPRGERNLQQTGQIGQHQMYDMIYDEMVAAKVGV